MTPPEAPVPASIKEELGPREQYRYVPQAEVSGALDDFGYGQTKKLVDAIYIHSNGKIAVGVLVVNKARCHDHLDSSVFRGVDGLEAMAQTLLLLRKFTGAIPDGMTPRLQKSSVNPIQPIVPDVDVNIVINASEEGIGGKGRIYVGEQLVSEGEVTGSILSKRVGDRYLERRKQEQARHTLLFPLVE